jgi:hypothetical protein
VWEKDQRGINAGTDVEFVLRAVATDCTTNERRLSIEVEDI